MKLHLPTTLRSALLACLALLPAWAPTVATGAIGGGLLALAYGGAAPAAEEQGLATAVADPVPYVGTVYTWVGKEKDIHEMKSYRVTTRTESGEWVLAENSPTEGWQSVWNEPSIPNVIRFDGTEAYRDLAFSFVGYKLSGIIVETGATGYSIKAEKSEHGSSRSIIIGNSGTETAHSTINEDFSIGNADAGEGSLITLQGTQKWTIAEGATLTLSSSAPIVHSGNLTVQGGGAATFASGLTLQEDSALTIGDGAEAVVVGTFDNKGGTISTAGTGTLVLQDVTATGLTVEAGKRYALSGASSLAESLTVEAGATLDISRLGKADWISSSGLTIKLTVDGEIIGGSTPHIFVGNDANLNLYAYYDEASKTFIAKNWADTELLHWVGGNGNNSWSAGANWQVGEAGKEETLAGAPEAGIDLRLLGTGTIAIDRDISSNRLIFGEDASGETANYTFDVAEGLSTALNAGSIAKTTTLLTKTGAGSLAMTKNFACLVETTVKEGTLVLSDAVPNGTTWDLTALTVAAAGNVSVAMSGGLGGSGSYGVLKLGSTYEGSLTIRSGALHTTNSTNLGNVSTFILGNKAGLLVMNQSTTFSQGIHVEKDGFLNVYKVSLEHTGALTGGSDTVFSTYGFGDANSKTTFHNLKGFHGKLSLSTYATTLAGGQGDVSIQGLLLNKYNDTVTLNIGAGTNVHIVGTTNSVAENEGSFLLAYGDPGRVGGTGAINIEGSLISEAGISTSPNGKGAVSDGRVGEINVKDGGVLQLNKGVRGESQGIVSVNVAEGGTLKVSGTDSATVDDRFTINMSNGSTLEGGAGGTDATVNQHLSIQSGSTVKVGAVNGKTLTLSASALSTVTGGTLDIIGDGKSGSRVALDSLKNAQVTLNAGAAVELAGQSSLTKLEVVSGSSAALSGNTALSEGLVVQAGGSAAITGSGVSLANMENNGTLDLSGLTRLTIGALQKGGAEVKIGAFTGTDDIVSLITRPKWVQITQETRDGVNYLISTDLHLYWKGEERADGTAVWDMNSATLNWSASSTATVGDKAFDENNIAVFAPPSSGISGAIVVDSAGVRAAAIHVTGELYSFFGGPIATSEIQADHSVTFSDIQIMDGRLDVVLKNGAEAKEDKPTEVGVTTLIGSGSDIVRISGEGALRVTGTNSSFGSLSVEGEASLKFGELVTAKMSVDNVTLASADGYAKNLVIREGEVKPYDAAAVAELHDIHLTAGSEGQHAAVSGVQFTGTANSIGGYLDMGDAAGVGVAAGGSLSVSGNGLVVDLGKVSNLEQEHTVISLADSSSTLKNWEENTRFFYNGIEMAGNVLVTGTAGKVTVALTQDKIDAGTVLYWDGSPSGVWDGAATNWSDAAGTDGNLAFKVFGNVQFGKVPEGGVKEVVQGETLPVGNMSVTEGGYAFSGAPLKVWGSLDVSAIGSTAFGSYVEAVRGIRLGNREENASDKEGITTAVTFGSNIKADSLTLQCGTADAPQAVRGTYTFQGIEVKTAVFDVDDMRLGGLNDADPRVVVNGSLVADSIFIRGNAAKEFKGKIIGGTVAISAGGDDRNVVVFGAQENDIDRIELMEGAKLSLAEDNQNITNIVVGDALLRFEKLGGYYNNSGLGYNIYSSHDNALLEMAGITYTTIAKLSGREGATGDFHSVTLDSMGRALYVRHVENLKDLTILSGTAEIGENVADWAEGGVHRDLVIKEEASVRLYKDNIMAQGSREMRVEDSILQLLGTTQTLYAAAAGGAGNSMYLDYADILGSSTGTGLHVVQAASGTPGTLNVTFGHINDVIANMTLDAGTTVNFTGKSGASLALSGVVSGAGNMVMEGAGSSVALMGQNTLTGTVTVDKGAELVVGNKNALQAAHLVMGEGSSLSLKTRGEYPVTLQTLALGNHVTINIDRLEGTDYANAAKAAFDVVSWSVGEGNTLTLNFTFGEGLEMEEVKTYNLFASVQDIEKTQLGALNISYADKNGQMVTLDRKNYVTSYTQVGDKYVFFIRTRFGNVWVGDTANGSGTWSKDGNGGNWRDGVYTDGTDGGKNAIFANLTGSDGKTATVTLVDAVQPGNVYFDARTTGYTLVETGSGKLAADTVIHTSGLGAVTLDLMNNATTDNAISGLRIHRGTMDLANHDLAFSGSIVVDPIIQREIALDTKSQYVVSGQYKAKGIFRGVTLEQGSIAGSSESLQAGKSSMENASVIANEAGGVTLSNVVMTGTGEVTNAIIGSGVSIGAKGNYTLSGTVWFDDSLKLEDGVHVTIATGSKTDIGGLRPEMKYDDQHPEDTVYTYTLMQNAAGGDAAAGSLTVPDADPGLLLLNGVTASSISVNGQKVVISYCKDANNNIIPGKIQLTLKGGDFTPWDERWGSKGPVAAVTNMGDSVLYDGSKTSEAERDKYLYSNVVAGQENENMVVASISRTWGSTDEKDKIPLIGSTGTDKEIWIYNHGSGNFSTLVTGSATEGSTQSGATHLMVMGGQAGENTVTVGGSRDAAQTGESFVTIDVAKEDNKTERGIVMGGSYGFNRAVTQTGASHLYMNGGTILNMLIAGSYEADMAADTFLDISGGSMKTVYGGSYATTAERGNTAGNITATLTGGEITTFYGGGTGNTGGEAGGQRKKLAVTVDGSKISQLFASNNGGNVTADIVLDLVSGVADRVMVASAGTEVHGSYTVKLHQGFTLNNAVRTTTDKDGKIVTVYDAAGIYGGHDRDTVLHANSNFTSRLELVDAGATYDFFPGDIGNIDQVKEIRGFDEIALADQVTLRVDNRHFCNNTSVILSTLNKGDMATVIFGKANADAEGSSQDNSRSIDTSMTLKEGITFKLETSFAYYEPHSRPENMPGIIVESGSMVDLTGFPREQGELDYGGCFAFQMYLAGDGIDGKGAIYKGAGEYSTSPDGKVAMPHIVLTDNASINAAASNIIVSRSGYEDSFMELQGHTLTKIGPQSLRFYASQEKATDGTAGKGGTFFIKEGVADYLKASDYRDVDYVLGKEGSLALTQHEKGTSLVLRSLSGDGTVNLSKNTTLTLQSDYITKTGVFYKDWLSQGKYNNTNSGGYAYGVFSGTIVSDDASSAFIKSGEGTQLLTGSDSTYQGLTTIQQGTLYLIGSSSGELTAPGESATVQKGVVGQSSIVWDSVDGSTPLLLLGNGVRIFNNGYALDGSDMIMAVSAAEQGASALNYVVKDAEGHAVTVERDGKTYYQMDTSRIKSVNATGFYADAATAEGKNYASGDVIDRNRTLYLSAEELGVTVGASLQTDSQATTLNYTLRDCEKIDVAKLQGVGLTSLDCNGYYGNGSAYKAGTAIDAALAESDGLFVTQNGMSPTAGRYLLYEAQPAIAYVPDSAVLAGDGATEPASGVAVETGTPYVQYGLGVKAPNAVPEALRGSDTLFYVKLRWRDTHGVTIVNRYMSYAGVQSVAAGKIDEATLISIDRVLFKEDATLTAEEKEAVKGLEMVMGEGQLVTKDIAISLEGLKVKDGVYTVAADGYYANASNTVTGVYHAGDAIDGSKGTLYIPSSSQGQSVVVVTGLNDSGYEEATYSGVLSDNGKESPSHLTKVGKGTLTIDQRNLYSGNTNLREGTLNLKGWGQLHRHADRSVYDFNQSRGTSLKLSYDGSYQSEAKELATDLTITGAGDARWLNEGTTGNRTAALISDVEQGVSFTLSGNISGDGNVLHSGEGQLHMSGDNSYEGGTTVTDGVVYVESATALGTTAGDNMASKVVVTKHTADGKGGTLVITNRPDGRDALGSYVRFNSNRNAIEGTVYIGGWDQGADITANTGANDTAGATLLMTGNGYWAEKTILSSQSALIFNGTASSNKEIEGGVMREAGLLTGSGILAVSGPAGIGTTVRFADIGNLANPAVALLAEAETEGFQGSIRVEGNNSRLEIGQGNYHADEGKSISISGYNATLEAANTAISVGSGGVVELASLGYLEEENGRGAAVLRAQSVSVGAGGSLATRNIGTIYRYNLAAIEEATQVSTHESLIGNRSGKLEYSDATSAKWKDMQADLDLPTEVDPKKPYTRSFIAGGAGGEVVNTNRAALADSDLSFAKGSTYEASYANTSLGHHALTLESGAGGNSAANRVTLDLSLNGSILQWDEKGRSTSQIVLFTDVAAVNFIYEGQEVNTDAAAYNGVEIFYMAAQDFFYDAYQGRYIDQDTLLVYDKGAQIVYLDRALPEPATATLSLLALAALVARRRRK